MSRFGLQQVHFKPERVEMAHIETRNAHLFSLTDCQVQLGRQVFGADGCPLLIELRL